MVLTKEKAALFQNLIDTYGQDAQLNMAVEELGELIVSIQHYRRLDEWGKVGSLDQIAEEVADVELMCEQLRYMFNFESLALYRIKERKLERVKTILAKGKRE